MAEAPAAYMLTVRPASCRRDCSCAVRWRIEVLCCGLLSRCCSVLCCGCSELCCCCCRWLPCCLARCSHGTTVDQRPMVACSGEVEIDKRKLEIDNNATCMLQRLRPCPRPRHVRLFLSSLLSMHFRPCLKDRTSSLHSVIVSVHALSALPQGPQIFSPRLTSARTVAVVWSSPPLHATCSRQTAEPFIACGVDAAMSRLPPTSTMHIDDTLKVIDAAKRLVTTLPKRLKLCLVEPAVLMLAASLTRESGGDINAASKNLVKGLIVVSQTHDSAAN